jgi:hypothetical protein
MSHQKIEYETHGTYALLHFGDMGNIHQVDLRCTKIKKQVQSKLGTIKIVGLVKVGESGLELMPFKNDVKTLEKFLPDVDCMHGILVRQSIEQELNIELGEALHAASVIISVWPDLRASIYDLEDITRHEWKHPDTFEETSLLHIKFK